MYDPFMSSSTWSRLTRKADTAVLGGGPWATFCRTRGAPAPRVQAALHCTAPSVALLMAMSLALPLSAQSLRDWRPIIQGGVSVNLVDLEDLDPSYGGTLRIGARLHPVMVSGVFLRWSDVQGEPMTSALVEVTYPGTSSGPVSAALVAMLGHTWWNHPRAPAWEDGKRAGGVGVSILARAAKVDLRFDALVRSDGDGSSAEFRLMGGWAPPFPARSPRGPSHFTLGSYWMFTMWGPWQFVEPAYMIRFSQPEVERWGGNFGLGLLRWETDERDTRALLAEPGVERRSRWGSAGLRFSGGPSLVVMTEGANDGPNLGAHFNAGVSLESNESNASISATGGWFWMRGTRGSRDSGGDVHGLTLGLMLEF